MLEEEREGIGNTIGHSVHLPKRYEPWWWYYLHQLPILTALQKDRLLVCFGDMLS